MSGGSNTFSAIPVGAVAGANRQITFGEGSAVNLTTGAGGSVGGFFDIPIGAQSSATGLASGDISVASNIITINRGGLYAVMVRIDSDSVAASDSDYGLIIPGLFDAPGIPVARVGTTLRSGRHGGMVALVPLAATQTLYIQGAASGDTVNAVLRWLRFQQVYDI
jgi:hypothetical protein